MIPILVVWCISVVVTLGLIFTTRWLESKLRIRREREDAELNRQFEDIKSDFFNWVRERGKKVEDRVWVSTRWEMRVHPTAKIVVRTFIDHPGKRWKWEIEGDTAVKWGETETEEEAKAEALAWWEKFSKPATVAMERVGA